MNYRTEFVICIVLVLVVVVGGSIAYKTRVSTHTPQYEVVLIDGCEYVKFHTDHAIIHKANCKNHEQ